MEWNPWPGEVGWRFSPLVLARLLWRLLCNITNQIEILCLLRDPAFRPLLRVHPLFFVKYLKRSFLVDDFSVDQHAECFLHHYRKLRSTFSGQCLRSLFYDDVALHTWCQGECNYRITMGLSRPFDWEGEMSIHFQMDGISVYVLSFTIVPGSFVHSQAHEVLLISRVQGLRDCLTQIRQSTRILHDLGLPALLFAALQGFGEGCGIGECAGVSALQQVSNCGPLHHQFVKAYDDFFTELGAAQNAGGFFVVHLPSAEKPLNQMKSGNRSRRKKQRFLKAEVAGAALQVTCANLREKSSYITEPAFRTEPSAAALGMQFPAL